MPWWVLAMTAAGVMVGSWLRWSAKETNARALEGQRALRDGDLQRAEAIFAAMMEARSTRRWGRELMATTRMRQERLQDAIDLYLAAEKPGGYGDALEIARLYALRGDAENATRFADDARRAVAPLRGMNRTSADARLLLIDALVAGRRGDVEQAWTALSDGWATFETSHGGWLAEACLLRGFFAWKLGSSVESWLGLSDAARDRVRWMAADWPDLRAFLDAHERS
jgi:hypothetical protein